MATPPGPLSLEDPRNEREIYANEANVLGSLQGNINITLSTARFAEPIEGGSPRTQRVIAARLVLTNRAANQLLQGLQRLAAQIEAAQKSSAGNEPS